MPPLPTVAPRANFARDLTSAVLFFAAGTALANLFAFIARKQLGASEHWVGIIGSAGYSGYLWNLLFGRATARFSLRSGIVVAMALGAGLMGIGAFQYAVWPYSAVVIAFLLVLGLYEVQYNTLLSDLYDPQERPKKLSVRQLAVWSAGALLSVLFGRMSAGGHTSAFLAGGVMMLAGAVAFRGIRTAEEHRMEPFHALDVMRTILHDVRFRRAAAILTLYGWAGAGMATLLVFLYQASGFRAQEVGQLAAIRTVGILLALVAVTPRLRFAGGITNFRFCFIPMFFASIVFSIAGLTHPGGWTFPTMALAELCFGVSVAVFILAVQTTGLNLAGPGQTTLYVNALMIVLGLRGMIAPLLVAQAVRMAGLRPTLLITVVVALACSVATMLPRIDGFKATEPPAFTGSHAGGISD